MAERPILFSGPMVRAILDGRKTQTRRIVKPQPHGDCAAIEVGLYHPVVIDRHGDEQPGAEIFGAYSLDGEWGVKCPYGMPADRVWVRETWIPSDMGGFHYRATDEVLPCIWRPSIHMPRKASRLTLEITAVRVERLQDISEADARAEGLALAGAILPGRAAGCFSRLWDGINGKRAPWSSNPWVWVIDFTPTPKGTV